MIFLRTDWIKRTHIRVIWAGILFCSLLYLMYEPTIYGGIMDLHGKLSCWGGYAVAAFCGAIAMCIFWGFTGLALQDTAKQLEQCGITDIKIEPVREDVMQINAVIKNFGVNIARGVSMTWYIDVIEGSQTGKPIIKKISSLPVPIITPPIDIIGGQEVSKMLVLFNRIDFGNLVRGDIDSLMRVSLSLEYKNKNRKKQPDLFVYHITRLADVKKDEYEVSLIKSELR
jgi:hypothetical protein